jgi:uncharacterized repeat protein (TIGR01451 family)
MSLDTTSDEDASEDRNRSASRGSRFDSGDSRDSALDDGDPFSTQRQAGGEKRSNPALGRRTNPNAGRDSGDSHGRISGDRIPGMSGENDSSRVHVRYIKPDNRNADAKAAPETIVDDLEHEEPGSRRSARDRDKTPSGMDEQFVRGIPRGTPAADTGRMEQVGEFSAAETRVLSEGDTSTVELTRSASPSRESRKTERASLDSDPARPTDALTDDFDAFSSDRDDSPEQSGPSKSNANPRLRSATEDESIEDLEVISTSSELNSSGLGRRDTSAAVPSLDGPADSLSSRRSDLEDNADFESGRDDSDDRRSSATSTSATSTSATSTSATSTSATSTAATSTAATSTAGRDKERALAVRASDDDIPIRPRGSSSVQPKPPSSGATSSGATQGAGLLSDELDVMSPTADSESSRHSESRTDSPASRTGESTRDEELPGDEPVDRPSDRVRSRTRGASPADAPEDGSLEAEDSPEFSLPQVVKDSPKAQLELAKEAPSDATLGQAMVYQIRVKNAGGMPAYKVVVRDPIPDGVDLKGTIPQAELAGKSLVWRFESLDPGEERVIKVRVTPRVVGTVGSVATATFSTQRQQAVAPAGLASGSQSSGVNGNLKFELVGPRRAVLNGPVLFKFIVKNTGRSRVTNVMIRDVLSPHFSHPDGDDLECPLGVLAPGETREEELELTAVKPGQAANQAVLTADGGISVEARAIVEISGGSIAVRRVGPKQLVLNRSGTYAITVENNGDLPLRDVELIEQLPAGLTFENASEGGRFDASRRSIVWLLGHLPAGSSQTVTSTLTAKTRGSHVAVIRVTDANGASGETVGTTVVAGAAALSIDLRDWPSSVAAGDEFSVTVRVINKGTEPATGVATTITLPPEVRLTGAKGPTNHKASGESVVFDAVDEIEPEMHVDYTLQLSARSPGDAVLQVTTQSDRMSRPVRRDEVVPILGESVAR